MMDLHDIARVGRPFEPEVARINGVAPAVVWAVYDSTAAKRHLNGRVQVWFPWLQDMSDPHLIRPWARLCMTAGGRGYPKGKRDSGRGHYTRERETDADRDGTVWGAGMFTPPSVGDEVLCAFEHGDIHHPYIVGTLWNGKERIPIVSDVTGEFKDADTVGGPNASAGPSQHGPITDADLARREKVGEDAADRNRLWFWRSRTGHLLIFDDSEEHPKIVISTASGKERVVLDEKNHKVQIVSGYFHKDPRAPVDGDGAPGDQDTGAGDTVEGGDVEILAKNRLWFKARKVDFEVSHNMHIHTGNAWSLTADGKISAQSGGNTAITCKRALHVTVKNRYRKPKNAPDAPPGSGQPGELHLTTDKQVLVKVKEQKLEVKVQKGSFDLAVHKDVSIKAQTGEVEIEAKKELSLESKTKKVKADAKSGLELYSIGPIKITACTMIKESAPLIKLN